MADIPSCRLGDRNRSSPLLARISAAGRVIRLRQALTARGITACIPSKVNRKIPIPHDTDLYRRRHKIEIMFGRLKDWRRIHTRYDRCAHTFMSAIALAATVLFWL
jgi:transposase